VKPRPTRLYLLLIILTYILYASECVKVEKVKLKMDSFLWASWYGGIINPLFGIVVIFPCFIFPYNKFPYNKFFIFPYNKIISVDFSRGSRAYNSVSFSHISVLKFFLLHTLNIITFNLNLIVFLRFFWLFLWHTAIIYIFFYYAHILHPIFVFDWKIDCLYFFPESRHTSFLIGKKNLKIRGQNLVKIREGQHLINYVWRLFWLLVAINYL
jgi:hypothetical protein